MSKPLMIRLLSASVAVANRAGQIIREVLRSGELGVVEKVLYGNAYLRVEVGLGLS